MWTMDDLRRASQVAASRCNHTMGLSRPDRIDIAWEAIALLVVENHGVSWGDAIRHGVDQIIQDGKSWHQMYGTRWTDQGIERGPRFAVYWLERRPLPPPTACLESEALKQVLAGLSDEHLELIYARAAGATPRDLAATLGVSDVTAGRRLKQARQAALDLWFDHEPAPVAVTDWRVKKTTCRRGHGSEYQKQMKVNGRITRRCMECHRIASLACKRRKESKE